jgi:hypothetical protein
VSRRLSVRSVWCEWAAHRRRAPARRSPDRGGERDDGIQPAQAAAEQIQRELRAGNVGDDEVEEPLTSLQARGLTEDRGRSKAGEVRENLRADSLAGLLQDFHRVTDLRQTVGWVLNTDGQGRPHRGDLVAERAALGVRADGDGDHRLEHESLGVLALRAQVASESEADGGEHDIVEGAAERVLDRFEQRQVGVDERVAAVRADVDVERARRRGCADAGEGGRAHARNAVLDLPGDLARRAQQRARATAHLSGNGRALKQRLAEQLGLTRQRLGDPRRRRPGGTGGFGGGVEQDGRDVHTGDPVHERVMGLGDQREPPARHALHEPDLPQRLGAVQALGEQPSGELLERGLIRRTRQRGVTDVVARVEMRIVRPQRSPLAERHIGQTLAIARHQVQAAEHMVGQLPRRRRNTLEHHHQRDMHVRGRVVLQMQERGIEGGQAVGIGHCGDCRCSGASRQRRDQKSQRACVIDRTHRASTGHIASDDVRPAESCPWMDASGGPTAGSP